MVPSAAALLTARRLPATSAAQERLIAFGDPLFSTEQALEADSKVPAASDMRVAMRGGQSLVRRSAPKLESLQHATLASLPRLPDTPDELRSVARALAVDPAKALHLGKEANEHAIRQADLSHYRVVMFATHGLVTGELDGLRAARPRLDRTGCGGHRRQWTADHGHDPSPQARCRLGRPLGL